MGRAAEGCHRGSGAQGAASPSLHGCRDVCTPTHPPTSKCPNTHDALWRVLAMMGRPARSGAGGGGEGGTTASGHQSRSSRGGLGGLLTSTPVVPATP